MSKQSASGYDLTPPSVEEMEKRAATLTAEERHILLSQGTERPFCGGYLDNKENGVYQCRLCDLPLFRAEHKFNSGTGWPSFLTASTRIISAIWKITATACCAPKYAVPVATPTSAMYFRMARVRPGCVTALTLPR